MARGEPQAAGGAHTLAPVALGAQVGAAAEPHGLWGRAFRPFFLGLSIHGALAIPFWVAVWLGMLPGPDWLPPFGWHAHEMLFGFVAAAIAGFLLTASPVWSGGPALRGAPLAALFALWVAGRVAMAAAAVLPAWAIAAIDGAFLPAVAWAALRTLWGSGQRRNFAVVGIVVALAVANGAVHAERLGLAPGAAAPALRFGVDAAVVLVLVIGGRITPAFTQNALMRRGSERRVRSWPALDATAVAAAAALAMVDLAAPRTALSGLLATLAGLAVALRLVGWQSGHVRADPLLWSLHLGAAWAAAGLLGVGAGDLGAPIPAAAGLHALTAGAMGTTILAVMTRVGLGHTGRPLVLPEQAVGCYGLVQVAAVARVIAAFVGGSGQAALLAASGVAWAGAFGLFALCYASILVEPRPDGRPG